MLENSTGMCCSKKSSIPTSTRGTFMHVLNNFNPFNNSWHFKYLDSYTAGRTLIWLTPMVNPG